MTCNSQIEPFCKSSSLDNHVALYQEDYLIIMTWKRALWVVPLILLIILGLLFFLGDWEYAYKPSLSDVSNPERTNSAQAYDVWGESFSHTEVDSLRQDDTGHRMFSPANGAVRVDDELLELGRDAFYKETFGNEIFFTDILGAMEGPLTFTAVTKALIGLRGRGTTNLQVKAAKDAVVGGREIKEGDILNTGLDVAKGAMVPIGMKVRSTRGKIRMGISCAACHSAYDPETEQVVEGAPNIDLNSGLLLAMGTNSSSFFANTDIDLDDLQQFVTEDSRTVMGSDSEEHQLPDPELIEQAVDSTLIRWPAGNFDSSNETRATPSQIPDSYTLGDHPYGWTGFAMAGPFKGLSMLNNNVHGMNSDKFADIEAFHQVHNIDRELYIGTLLQNAAHEDIRYNPDTETEETPSEFFARVNPTEDSPVLNNAVTLPTYPLASFVTPNGLWIGTPGHNVWEEVNAMSAFQNTLIPPEPPELASPKAVEQGREVFTEAGCRDCHSGPAFTNNQVLPVDSVGTEPMRARAFEEMDEILVPPSAHPFNVEIPVASGSRVIDVPMDRIDQDQIERAWAIRGKEGGYKVKGLLGLYWTPPYLHDGGVAVGSDPQTQLGLPGTVLSNIPPDPFESLRAMVDRELRDSVLQANRSMEGLDRVNVRGTGHEFWVDDESGFTPLEQENLIYYLLQLKRNDRSLQSDTSRQ